MNKQVLVHNKRFTVVFLIIVFVVLLAACGSGSSNGQLNIGTGDLVIEYPASLSKYVKEDTVLTARISVDRGEPVYLTVDKRAKKVTGSIDNLSDGDHMLMVEYLIEQDGELVSIATGMIHITVGDFEIIALLYRDFIYTDSDNDGVTNIAELAFGTNLLDPSSRPDAHGIHASESYSTNDQPINRSVVVGIASSKSYTFN